MIRIELSEDRSPDDFPVLSRREAGGDEAGELRGGDDPLAFVGGKEQRISLFGQAVDRGIETSDAANDQVGIWRVARREVTIMRRDDAELGQRFSKEVGRDDG